jgi:hypothetical protein
MATKNMAYDHPAYTGVRNLPVIGITAGLSGSGGTGIKYCSFTAQLVKSVTLKAITAGTSNDVSSLIQISGTTTTTTALATIGSGSTAVFNAAAGTSGQIGNAMVQGDTYYVVKGTDLTAVLIGEIEVVTQPLANVTV